MAVLAILAAVVASACSNSDGLLKRIATPEAERFGQEFIQILARGDTAMALSLLDPQTRGPDADSGVAHIMSAIHGRPVTGLKLIRVQRRAEAASDILTMGYEGVVADGGTLIATVVLARTNSRLAVTGANVLIRSKSETMANRFTLSHRAVQQYMILGFGVLVVLFVLYTLVKIVRTKPARQWLWFAFSLFPIGTIGVNWATGETRVRVMSTLLLGFAMMKNGSYGAWIVQAAFPIGAVLFHIRHRQSRSSSELRADGHYE